MNTTINNNAIAVSANPVTAKMIAEKLGVSTYTVWCCMGETASKRGLSQKMIDLVHRTAQEMGYDPKAAKYSKATREKAVKTMWLRHSNFETRELETERMITLRAQGYSNAEIAKKIGRDYQTVRRRIGCQDEDMSLANRIQGAKNVAARNAQRRQYVADHTVSTYNGIVTELAEVRDKLVKLEDQAVEMRPRAVEASKIAKVKMIQDLSGVSATSVQ